MTVRSDVPNAAILKEERAPLLADMRIPGNDASLHAALHSADLPMADLDEPGQSFLAYRTPDGAAVGFGGYECLGIHALIRSVVVIPEVRGNGIGRNLVAFLLRRAFDDGVRQAWLLTICVRTSATEGMRRHALNLSPQQDGCGCSSKESWEELAALGAALAVNSTQNIDKHLATARGRGIPQEELDEVFALTRTIRARAIQHGEARLGRLDTRAAEGACGCAPAFAACG
jgi:GNAT superfamily N-acetyltransferase